MIYLNARSGRLRGVNHVLINGQVDLDVFAIWLAWQDGPALIGYYPRTVAGALYIAPDGDVAVAYRFVRRARVVMAKEAECKCRPIGRRAHHQQDDG